MVKDDNVDWTIMHQYPNEYLNTLIPLGLPPFKLDLKEVCPIMLLRNIAPKDGLCNGTRLIIVKCGALVLEAKILTGDKHGDLVFIPRISLTPSSDLSIKMTRRQFPVRLTLGMILLLNGNVFMQQEIEGGEKLTRFLLQIIFVGRGRCRWIAFLFKGLCTEDMVELDRSTWCWFNYLLGNSFVLRGAFQFCATCKSMKFELLQMIFTLPK